MSLAICKFFLLPHQTDALNRCRHLETADIVMSKDLTIRTRLGILSGTQGSGKTRVIVSLMDHDPFQISPEQRIVKCMGSGFISMYQDIRSRRINTQLIIASPSSFAVWKKELSCKKAVFINNWKEMLLNINNPPSYLVVRPSLYPQIARRLHHIYWKRIIFDEPILCRLKKIPILHSNFVWFLCSNPLNMFYHRSSKQNFYLKDLDESTFEKLVVTTPIQPFFHTDYIVWNPSWPKYNSFPSICHLTYQQCYEYLQSISSISFFPLQNILDNHVCSICLDKPCVNDNIIMLCCGKSFCNSCLFMWKQYQQICPSCRHGLSFNHMIFFHFRSAFINPVNDFNTILQKLLQDPHKCILLYTSNTDEKLYIRSILETHNYKYTEYSHHKIQDLSTFRIIFLTDFYHTSGLELLWVTDIIFYSRNNMTVSSQILGRVIRLGQTKTIRIHEINPVPL